MVYLDLFITFFKIGAFTFGGGYAMIALIQSEVISHGWATQEAVVNFVAISESTPGPLAVNCATFVGQQVGGIVGSMVATLGLVLPSFIVIMIIARMYEKYQKNQVVKGCMRGLKPAVVGMLGTAILSSVIAVFGNLGLGEMFYTDPKLYCTIVILVIAILMERKKMHPIAVLGTSALLGIGCGLLGFI